MNSKIYQVKVTNGRNKGRYLAETRAAAEKLQAALKIGTRTHIYITRWAVR